jgi:hypothetical protein
MMTYEQAQKELIKQFDSQKEAMMRMIPCVLGRAYDEIEHLQQENATLTARIAELEAEASGRDKMIKELQARIAEWEFEDFECQVEELQWIVDRSDGAGEVDIYTEGFWLDFPDEEDETPSIYLGKDFEEARTVLEKRRDAYIDAYLGDALKR